MQLIPNTVPPSSLFRRRRHKPVAEAMVSWCVAAMIKVRRISWSKALPPDGESRLDLNTAALLLRDIVFV